MSLALAGGLLLLGAIAYAGVVAMQGAAMEEAMEIQSRRIEEHVDRTIRQLVAEEFTSEGGDLAGLGARLIAVFKGNPAILDLVVVDLDRRVVDTLRPSGPRPPCLQLMPFGRAIDHEHEPGAVASEAVACKSLPIEVQGRTRGLVFYHAVRDWRTDGAHLGAWVRRTALRVGSVFVGFYVVLGVLLVYALRARDRWRARAASAERVETLGVLAEGINHEIKNPLNAVGLSLQLLARKHADDAETRSVVATAAREADRIRTTLEQFGRYTRVSRLDAETVDVGAWLRDRFGPALDVRGDARGRFDVSQMTHAFDAIVGLLQQHGDAQLAVAPGRGGWRFAGGGDAPGLDAAAVTRLFDPYVRPGPHDVCCGLGLARAVFQAHGGVLDARLKGRRLLVTGHVPDLPEGKR